MLELTFFNGIEGDISGIFVIFQWIPTLQNQKRP